ncbi:DMT family transporter [Chromobacterium sp. IIBBL 290-4]|uniref:DMT family transporter n=1 Tax=Chromobacterium sp. IIBBL 290-4 TaxID=2953890 RepID=UPI0020B69DEF|nr:DMT family transporter [Chromobacterium sp. IIBBL 290-4]UTH75372.1 DMT family transporter [Chromobacterium sp. IIBBL 290-4]
MPDHRHFATPRLYLQLILVMIIWGGTFIAGRQLAGHAPPLLAAALRFAVASLCLLGFLALSRTPLTRPTPRQALRLLLLGLCGIFGYNLCFFYGLQHVSASRASLIVALNPAAIALASRLFLGERLPAGKLAGVALSLAGAALVILGRDASALGGAKDWSGDLLILGCVASWAAYSVASRGLSQTLGPLQTVTWSILFGTLMLLAAAALSGDLSRQALDALGGAQWSGLLYLGALGSALAYIWYYDGIRALGPTRTGVFIALNPLSAVLLGALLLGEKLTPQMGLGGALAIAGILLSNLARDKAPAAAAIRQS